MASHIESGPVCASFRFGPDVEVKGNNNVELKLNSSK
jgi:hypothetical protein